ncbi:MAG TPA: ATP-binding cassette domain-containing protein, partial [Kribbella sp.]|nr:ATP-binding cassette domain-containing protein [Kribbella sp.]
MATTPSRWVMALQLPAFPRRSSRFAPSTPQSRPGGAMTSPVLEIKNFHVDYGLGDEAVQAVRDVTLTLHRGEVLGLAGESGSGKSTLA